LWLKKSSVQIEAVVIVDHQQDLSKEPGNETAFFTSIKYTIKAALQRKSECFFFILNKSFSAFKTLNDE
jgi:hypothetical protein